MNAPRFLSTSDLNRRNNALARWTELEAKRRRQHGWLSTLDLARRTNTAAVLAEFGIYK